MLFNVKPSVQFKSINFAIISFLSLHSAVFAETSPAALDVSARAPQVSGSVEVASPVSSGPATMSAGTDELPAGTLSAPAPSASLSPFTSPSIRPLFNPSWLHQKRELPKATLDCKLEVLSKLGWQVERNAPGVGGWYNSTNSCQFRSFEVSQSSGLMKIGIPWVHILNQWQIEGMVDDLLRSPQTLCNFKLKFLQSVDQATQKLSANKNYEFSRSEKDAPFIEIQKDSKWIDLFKNGMAIMPGGKVSEAMEEFYSGKMRTECAVGQQVAQYAAVKELYGNALLDLVFKKDDFALAPFSVIGKSPSITRGTGVRYWIKDWQGLSFAKMGAPMLAGVTGYIGNMYGESFLDEPVDRGENFLVVKASEAATQEIVKRGGIGGFSQTNYLIWKLSGLFKGDERNFLDMTLEDASIDEQLRDQAPHNTLSGDQKKALKIIQKYFKNPVYKELVVFVHPLGQMTIAEHIVRLLNQNPRTPYGITFYEDSVNGSLFERYVDDLLGSCRT